MRARSTGSPRSSLRSADPPVCLAANGRCTPTIRGEPMEPIAQFDAVIDTLRPVVAGIRQDQLTRATPCAKWTVADLLNHIVGGGHAFAAAFRGTPFGDADAAPSDLLGGD